MLSPVPDTDAAAVLSGISTGGAKPALTPSFRVVMYGDSGVGKTSLMTQFAHMRTTTDKRTTTQPREIGTAPSTIGAEFWAYTHHDALTNRNVSTRWHAPIYGVRCVSSLWLT
jgi:GTPase SAR1 family protein